MHFWGPGSFYIALLIFFRASRASPRTIRATSAIPGDYAKQGCGLKIWRVGKKRFLHSSSRS
jgi:hypothetical protein